MDIKNIMKKTVIPVIAGAVILTAVSDTGTAQARETKHPNYSLAAGEEAIISRGWLDQDVSVLADMANYPAIDETNGAKTTADWAASGLSKDNSTGIITIADGYHAESKIIGACGDAEDWQVLDGVAYSSKTGAHTGSMPDRGAPSTILTSSNKSVTFPSGYYEEFKVSTDVKDADIPNASIEYIHHQDSLTSTSETYTDTVADASNAKALSLVEVNGVTCSTTGGGCYTTPYYRYEWNTTEQETRRDCKTDPGCWTGDGSGYEWRACDNPATNCKNVVVRTYTVHHTDYGYSTGGHEVTGTWYVKSCGKSNGQLVQANIIYH